jgi:peptide/nickel transport system permease protein
VARSWVTRVLEQEYVTFARARGLSSRRVFLLYALRNGLIPVITVSVPLIASLITGAVLVEATFSVPGIWMVAEGWPLDEDLREVPWGLRDFRILDPAGYYLRVTDRGRA